MSNTSNSSSIVGADSNGTSPTDDLGHPSPAFDPTTSAAPTGAARITWEEAGQTRSALWRSESGWAPPKRVVIADDRLTADAAYRLAQNGTGILWRGDFLGARQLLSFVASMFWVH